MNISDNFLDRNHLTLACLLPQMNNLLEQKKLTIHEMMTILPPIIYQYVEWHSYRSVMITPDEAVRAIQQLGMIMSSMETHSQMAKNKPGVVIQQFPEVEEVLLSLSKISGHPPRDTHYTYWIWNQQEPCLMFLGDRGETLFREVVFTQYNGQKLSCNRLRHVCVMEEIIDDESIAEAFHESAKHNEMIFEQYGRFMIKDENGERHLTGEVFTIYMRTYLATYPIGGKTWTGVNAAYFAEPISQDYLFGCVDEDYAQKIAPRLQYMIPCDRDRLLEDMKLKSITSLLMEYLDWTSDIVLNKSHTDLYYILREHPKVAISTNLTKILKAYTRLYDSISRLTARHDAMIHYYLRVFPTKVSGDKADRLKSAAVPVSTGTSQGGLDEVDAISKMRRKHPVITRMTDAFKLLTSEKK